jgi:stage IV sporulation protein FB
VLLGEPPRSPYDLNFSLLGIPVRVHPLFWLVTLMLGYNLGDVPSVLTWIAAVFLSILVHELGHAATMRAYGFRPWITLYGLGGQTAYDQGYAFRAKRSGTLDQVLISAAGPAAGFLLAAGLVLGLMLADYGHVLLNASVARLVHNMLFICIAWGLVNLLPIYPLDGGQIAREILLKISFHNGVRWSLGLSIVAAGAMAAVGFLLWRDWFVVVLFGYLAYVSYTTLKAYRGRNPW